MLNRTNVHRWLFPVLYSTVLFGVLLFLFPFDTGYSTERSPLGFALWSTWTTTAKDAQDYSYCLLVPAIVAYFVFEKRSQLAKAPVRGSNAAIWWILLGLLLFWIGSKAGKQYFGCAGIQVLLAGTILWFWGVAVFRLLLFAWALVSFAWPLAVFDSTIAFPMRIMVSQLSYHTLNLIGFSCVRNGTAIFSAPDPATGLPLGSRFQIDIADPCSGIHSLLALMLFSALYSYFFLPRRWQQWTVFLSVLPLTIVGNVVRILLLVIGSISAGMAFAIGTNESPSWFHEACGFAVFIVVLGLEFFLGATLIAVEKKRSGHSRRRTVKAAPDSAKAQDQDIATLGTVPHWRGYVILALTGTMVVAFLVRPPPTLPPEAGVVMSLPQQVIVPEMSEGKFYGSLAAVSEAEHRILPKDTAFARMNYDDFHGHTIFFSIVLSGMQQYSIHRPEVCLVAQGWRITGEEDVPVHLLSGHDLTVHNLSIEHDAVDVNHDPVVIKSYFMYWYVAEGVMTSSHMIRNLVSSWDRVVYNRDHRWAYVVAMSPITESIRSNGLNAEQTRQMLTDFIRQIVPDFQKSEMIQTAHD